MPYETLNLLSYFFFQSFSLGLQLVMIRMKRNIGCLVHGLER